MDVNLTIPYLDIYSGHKILPLGEGSRASPLVLLTTNEVTLLIEMVVGLGMDRAEFLQRLHPSESEHDALSAAD